MPRQVTIVGTKRNKKYIHVKKTNSLNYLLAQIIMLRL